MKYVRWGEPYGPAEVPIVNLLTVEAAIIHQKFIMRHLGLEWTDKQYLDEFMVVHWADIVEVEFE